VTTAAQWMLTVKSITAVVGLAEDRSIFETEANCLAAGNEGRLTFRSAIEMLLLLLLLTGSTDGMQMSVVPNS